MMTLTHRLGLLHLENLYPALQKATEWSLWAKHGLDEREPSQTAMTLILKYS